MTFPFSGRMRPQNNVSCYRSCLLTPPGFFLLITGTVQSLPASGSVAFGIHCRHQRSLRLFGPSCSCVPVCSLQPGHRTHSREQLLQLCTALCCSSPMQHPQLKRERAMPAALRPRRQQKLLLLCVGCSYNKKNYFRSPVLGNSPLKASTAGFPRMTTPKR